MSDPAIWTDDFLDRMRQQTDSPADEAVARLVEESGEEEVRRLFDLLIRCIELPLAELPPVLRDFLADNDRLPAWVDPEKVAVAHEVFLDHGPKFLLFLYLKSLPLLYTDWRGARVLVRTGRLSHEGADRKIFARRIAETGQFLIEVMTEGALRPGGLGIQAIQKVRLIHAAIRRFVQRGEWDAVAWGRPINQEDMALTLLTFGLTNLEALNDLWVGETPERREAFLHTWNGIGELLGVHPDLLAPDYASGRQLLGRILTRVSGPSEEGKVLTQALEGFLYEHLSLGKNIRPALLIRYFVGEERASMLGLAPSAGCWSFWLPQMLRAYFVVGEQLEEKADGPLRSLFENLSRKVTHSMVDYFDQYKGRYFTIPRYMLERWLDGKGDGH